MNIIQGWSHDRARPVSAALEADLREQARQHSILVWSPTRHSDEVTERVTLPQAEIIRR